jgi:sugar lactone lactonase YvrE
MDGRTGVLYIADRSNDRIYQVTKSGKVTHVAGTGERGFSGDRGRATEAKLNGPAGLAVDREGNLFVADEINGRVRKVGPDGVITTIAGAGGNLPPVGGNFATLTKLDSPRSVAVDHDGNLFIAEGGSQLVRRVGADGRIVTVAGGGSKAVGEVSDAREVKLSGVTSLTVDARGNVYFTTSSHQVARVSPDGHMVIVAGNGSSGFSGDGGPATKAQFAFPSGLAVDSRGEVFIADELNGRVRKVAVDGTITTVAGGGTKDVGDGGKATETSLTAPRDLAVDGQGNVLIANPRQGALRKLWRSGRITTVAQTTPKQIGSSTTTSTTSTPSTTTATIEPTGLVFQDDFSQSQSTTPRWQVFDTATSKAAYADGGYRLTAMRGIPGIRSAAPLTNFLKPNGRFPNDALTIEAKVTFMPVSPSLLAGLTCRGTREYTGYSASVRGDGYWSITRFDAPSGAGRVLVSARSRSDYALELAGAGPHQVRLDCLGKSDGPVTLALTVNGYKVAEEQDVEALPPGLVNVTASLAPGAIVESGSVLFDDFVVTRQRP